MGSVDHPGNTLFRRRIVEQMARIRPVLTGPILTGYHMFLPSAQDIIKESEIYYHTSYHLGISSRISSSVGAIKFFLETRYSCKTIGICAIHVTTSEEPWALPAKTAENLARALYRAACIHVTAGYLGIAPSWTYPPYATGTTSLDSTRIIVDLPVILGPPTRRS